MGGVAVGCAILGFVVMNFLAGGGGGNADDDSAVLSTSTAPLASPGAPEPGSDAAAAASPSATPANQLVPGGRDPFDAGSLSATPAPAPTVAPAPVAPVPVQPQPTQAPVPQAYRTDPVIVGIKSVSADAADVWIDDTEHSAVSRGEELDARFAVERIDTASRCAILRDTAAPSGSQSFTLCENQTVRR
jgi:hypothetical protein